MLLAESIFSKSAAFGHASLLWIGCAMITSLRNGLDTFVIGDIIHSDSFSL